MLSLYEKINNISKFEKSSKFVFKTYLKPIAACQTKASKRKNTGMEGITSTIGRNAAYASGNAAIKKLTFIFNKPQNSKKSKNYYMSIYRKNVL